MKAIFILVSLVCLFSSNVFAGPPWINFPADNRLSRPALRLKQL
jgi:hypothetical protein